MGNIKKKKNYTLDIFFELATCKCIFCCKSFDAALLSYRSTDYSPGLTQTTPIMHQPQFLVSTSSKVKQDLRDICQGSKWRILPDYKKTKTYKPLEVSPYWLTLQFFHGSQLSFHRINNSYILQLYFTGLQNFLLNYVIIIQVQIVTMWSLVSPEFNQREQCSGH